MTDAAILAEVTRDVLLTTISERAVAPGLVIDLARRIAMQASEAGVPADDVIELQVFGSRS